MSAVDGRALLSAASALASRERVPTLLLRPTFYSLLFPALALFLLLELLLLPRVLPRVLRRISAPELSWDARVRLRQEIISLIHDLYAIPASIFLITSIVPHNEFAVLRHIPLQTLDTVGGVFVAYLLWDLQHLVRHRELFASELIEQLAHHGCFFAMMLLNGDERSFNYAFPFIYLGELSTLFLNIRTMYKALGREELWVSLCFAVSFFVTRILLFGGLLVHLWREREAVQILLGRALQVAEKKKREKNSEREAVQILLGRALQVEKKKRARNKVKGRGSRVCSDARCRRPRKRERNRRKRGETKQRKTRQK